MEQTLRMDIVKLLVIHGVPASELVPTARDVMAFLSEGVASANMSSTTAVLVADNKKPEPAAEERRTSGDEEAAAGAFVRWTPERIFELERWCASGARYQEIAGHFETTEGAIRFATKKFRIATRWPRRRRELLFTPIPLDAPWPDDQVGADVEAEADDPERGIMPILADTVPAREVLPARRARRAPQPADTSPTPAEAFIVDWAREHGIDTAKIDGVWRWEKDTGLTFRQVLKRANDLRIRNGLSPFADPEPDPLAAPAANGRSICGSSLGSVG